MAAPTRELERDLDLGRRCQAALLASIDAAVAAGLHGEASTRLPGWTVAHLLAHLARNADSHRRMIEGADRGDVLEQYEGGVAGRTAGIEAGVGRSIEELVEDVRSSSTALEQAWAATGWEGSGRRTLSQTTPISRLPFLRSRETQLHLVDLDVGVEFADLDPLYVRLDVDRLSMLWCARQPMGMAKLPAAALALPPVDRLAWLTGRRDVDGLAPAGIF